MYQSKNSLFSLFLFTLPSIFSSMIEPLSSIVDTALIGNLDTRLLGALSIGVTLITTFTYVFNFIVHTTTASISGLTNSNKNQLNEKISLTITTSLVVGLLASIFLFYSRNTLYSFMGVSKLMQISVDQYFEVRSVGHVFVLFYIGLIAVLRGMKKVNIAFFLIVLTTLLNVLLSYLLIYYFNLGIQGAAYGTVLANMLGVLISLLIIYKNGFKFTLKTQKFEVFHYSKDSMFLFFRSLFLSFCFFLSARQANLFGKNHLATYQILINLWLFISFFIDGIAVSATILFSESKSKNDFVSLKKHYQQFIKLTFIISIVLTIIYLLFPLYIFSMFTYDQEVIKILFVLWPLIWLFQVPNSIAFLYDGMLFGLSQFRFLSIHMMIGTSVIALPLIYLSKPLSSFLLIFVGHILLNFYRLISCHFKIQNVLEKKYCE